MTKQNQAKLLALSLTVASGAALAAPPDFETIDVNADGKLTLEEAGVVRGLDFESADKDRDGVLTRKEYVAAAAKIK